MCGLIIYLGIALVLAAIFNSFWIFIGAGFLLVIYMACELFGLIEFPGGNAKRHSIKSEKKEPPDYVMFDDLDDI